MQHFATFLIVFIKSIPTILLLQSLYLLYIAYCPAASDIHQMTYCSWLCLLSLMYFFHLSVLGCGFVIQSAVDAYVRGLLTYSSKGRLLFIPLYRYTVEYITHTALPPQLQGEQYSRPQIPVDPSGGHYLECEPLRKNRSSTLSW